MKLNVRRQPDFARLRKALLVEGEPDRVPNLELGVHPVHKARVIGRPCKSVEDEIDFARMAGYDYIKLQPAIDMNPAKILPLGGARTFEISREGGQRRWADEHQGIIADWQQFEDYVWPAPEQVSYERLEQAGRLLPEAMGVIAQYGDIYTWIWENMGFERFSMALYENPELVQALFEKVGGIVYNLFENMASFEHVQALWYSDDLAYTGGMMIAPDFLREYLFPWVKKIGELCRERNIPFLYHSDGVLWDVIDDLIECGVTSLHPIEPKSMEILEVKQRAAGRLAVVGNIEVDLLARGTPEQIEQEVRDRLRRVAPGGGYCLGSSNSVPEYCSYDNYIAMLNASERWGAYPIEVGA